MKKVLDGPIGIIDSGVGGLTVLKKVDSMLPDVSVIYFGDTKRMPYGNRTKEEIVEYANAMIAFLEKRGVKAVLLACNTISSYIDELTSNVELFSIVEAGIRSIKNNTEDSIGLIATCATVESGSYQREAKKAGCDKKIIGSSSSTLPRIIDSNIDDKRLLTEKIKECIDPIIEKNENVRHIILGCSHFPIVKNEIEQIYPQIDFIDPASKQVDMLKEKFEIEKSSTKRIDLFTTAETYEFAAMIKRLGLEVDSLIKVKLYEND